MEADRRAGLKLCGETKIAGVARLRIAAEQRDWSATLPLGCCVAEPPAALHLHAGQIARLHRSIGCEAEAQRARIEHRPLRQPDRLGLGRLERETHDGTGRRGKTTCKAGQSKKRAQVALRDAVGAVDVGLGYPRQHLHQGHARIVDIVVGPCRRDDPDQRPPFIDQIGPAPIIEIRQRQQGPAHRRAPFTLSRMVPVATIWSSGTTATPSRRSPFTSNWMLSAKSRPSTASSTAAISDR
jgi:hypothetical protein